MNSQKEGKFKLKDQFYWVAFFYSEVKYKGQCGSEKGKRESWEALYLQNCIMGNRNKKNYGSKAVSSQSKTKQKDECKMIMYKVEEHSIPRYHVPANHIKP